DQGRVNGIEFETAVFTNLTQDHLDYHHTMENYYQAKRKLFYWQGLKNLVINTDDNYGKRLCEELEHYAKHKSLGSMNPKILTYGIISGDVRATDIVINLTGTTFTLIYSGQQVEIKANVIGVFNVYNILGVVSCLILDGYSLLDITRLINYITPIRGRMEAIFNQGLPLVIIDFAHTPDALEKTLQSLHKVKNKQKIYCVFGCGGDRDPLKRPIMGSIATQNADYTIITSDNPRTEAPNLIIEQIIAGVDKKANPFEYVENRTEAINKAIKMAQSNDIVLIAGKGHEEYQDIMGVKYHFSDYEVAKMVLENITCN
ncbi:MAG: UDP-N-acetylmuramoyl-L-alanyl-D-glutamate--2,6-diaminopimelate ligase, partial [Burkholderiales bacterium]|nr:UDP-N-acetylmuramoyl-L-alanyl-D-glutamate--2,6-diaminopimelate ligase [Burkholderiales bacterium]